MKKLFTFLVFLCICFPAWATTYYVKIAGGNSNAATTYSATSSAGVDNAGVPTSAIDLVMDAASATTGAFVINATLSCKTFDSSANVAGTITHNTAVGWATNGNVTFGAGTTYTPGATAFITFNANGTLTTNGIRMPYIVLQTGTTTLGSNLIFRATKDNYLQLNGNFLTMGGFTITGDSAVNRPIIRSNTLGTPRTVASATATSFNNVDLRDISFSSAGNLDLTNGGANSIGDCGGNSATGGTLTMTSSTTQTYGGGTHNWSEVGSWTSRVPLPQDDVIIGSGTITSDMPRLGRDITFSGGPTWTRGINGTSYGSWTNVSGMTVTSATSFSHAFESQYRTGTISITSASKTFNGNAIFACYGTIASLADAFSVSSGGTIFIQAGTVTATSSVSAGRYSITGGTTNMGSYTWTMAGSGTTNDWTVSGGTINAQSSTISINNTSATQKEFEGGGQTYNILTLPAGTGGTLIKGSNIFTGYISVDAGGKLTLTAGTTQQVANFVATGSVGNVITLNSSSAGTAATLQKTGGGQLQCDWIDITDINVTPSAAPGTWFYGYNSNWHSGTGWNTGAANNPALLLAE